jgi:hypothetical protein
MIYLGVNLDKNDLDILNKNIGENYTHYYIKQVLIYGNRNNSRIVKEAKRLAKLKRGYLQRATKPSA